MLRRNKLIKSFVYFIDAKFIDILSFYSVLLISLVKVSFIMQILMYCCVLFLLYFSDRLAGS